MHTKRSQSICTNLPPNDGRKSRTNKLSKKSNKNVNRQFIISLIFTPHKRFSNKLIKVDPLNQGIKKKSKTRNISLCQSVNIRQQFDPSPVCQHIYSNQNKANYVADKFWFNFFNCFHFFPLLLSIRSKLMQAKCT